MADIARNAANSDRTGCSGSPHMHYLCPSRGVERIRGMPTDPTRQMSLSAIVPSLGRYWYHLCFHHITFCAVCTPALFPHLVGEDVRGRMTGHVVAHRFELSRCLCRCLVFSLCEQVRDQDSVSLSLLFSLFCQYFVCFLGCYLI